MNITKRREAALVAGVLALALVAAACGSDNSSSGVDDARRRARRGDHDGRRRRPRRPAGATTTVKVSGTIQGSGSTFQQPYQERGRRRLHRRPTAARPSPTAAAAPARAAPTSKNKVVDFAGSDSPYADADKPAEPILYFPILSRADHRVLQPVRASTSCSSRPDTIAKIFQRQITTWNDPAIAADNPGVTLPATAITVAHRSDGSGTTQNFTKYLVAAAPTTWTLEDRVHRRVAGRHPGRQRQRRRGPDRQAAPTARSATSTLRRRGRQARRSPRSRTGGQVHRARRRSRPRRPATASTVKPDLTFIALNTVGADGLPDHGARPGSSSTRRSPTPPKGNAAQGVRQLPRSPTARSCWPTSTSPRCRRRSSSRPSPSSTRSRSAEPIRPRATTPVPAAPRRRPGTRSTREDHDRTSPPPPERRRATARTSAAGGAGRPRSSAWSRCSPASRCWPSWS